MAEQLVEALDVRVHVGREPARRELVGDQQVDAGQRGEHGQEDGEQRGLGPDDAPEHVGPAEAVVPEEVDVEAGDGPAEHDDEEEQDAEDDEDRPPGRSPAGAASWQVRGAPHGRERYPSTGVTRQRHPACDGALV